MLANADSVSFLPTLDVGRSRAFFEGLLGLPVIDASPYACVFRVGGGTLRVTPVETLVPQPFTVFGWAVADIRTTIAGLVAAGVVMRRYEGMAQDELGVWTTPGGDLVAWFLDPDGNTLSLTEFAA